MQALMIVVLSLLAAVSYGIVHDQITARICLEYFTIGHPRLIASNSPTVLAIFWGIVATWWVGLPLGILLAAAARWGRRPKLTARQLLRPLLKLLGIMFTVALCAGLIGFLGAHQGMFRLAEPLASSVPTEKQNAFLADAGAHLGSYLAGLVGGAVLCFKTWRQRRHLPQLASTAE